MSRIDEMAHEKVNKAEKLFGLAVLIALFGALFLFTSGSSQGTFNELIDISDEASVHGNATGWTQVAITMFPFGLFIIFLGFIIMVMFKL